MYNKPSPHPNQKNDTDQPKDRFFTVRHSGTPLFDKKACHCNDAVAHKQSHAYNVIYAL